MVEEREELVVEEEEEEVVVGSGMLEIARLGRVRNVRATIVKAENMSRRNLWNVGGLLVLYAHMTQARRQLG